MTWIIAKLVLGGVPQRFAKVLAYLGAIIAAIAFLGALVALVSALIDRHDRGVVNDYEAGVQVDVGKATQAGAQAAASASASTSATIEAGNDAARKAAAGSDDRLKAGLDALK